MTATASPIERVSPHAIRHDVLQPDDLAELLTFALGHEADLGASKIDEGDVTPTFRSSRVLPRRMFEPWRARIERSFGALLPGICAELGMAPFPVAHFELELAAHNDGDFYRTHIDTKIGTPGQRGVRVVSMVYYFHAEPKGFTGGALRIFSLASEAVFADIAPDNNRLVAFPSWVPHEVRPILCPSRRFDASRFSINCWARSEPAAPGKAQS